MSIWQAIKLTTYPPKEYEKTLKEHPVLFFCALVLLIIFLFPVILFDYITQKQWRW